MWCRTHLSHVRRNLTMLKFPLIKSMSPMKVTTKRWLLRCAGILAVLWLGFVAFVDWAMHQPPEVFGRVMMPVLWLAFLWLSAEAGHDAGLRMTLAVAGVNLLAAALAYYVLQLRMMRLPGAGELGGAGSRRRVDGA